MASKKIPEIALQKGPDLFFPGSRTQQTHRGMGLQTFIYTKYPDNQNNHLFVAPAGTSHISLIKDNPEVLKALFGDKLDQVMPEITEKINGKLELDVYAVRSKSIDDNIYGRTGYYGNHKVVMFWYVSDWSLAIKALNALNANDTDIVTVSDKELGTVASVKKLHGSKAVVEKKADEKKQRALDLIKYHTATGAEKEALKQKLFSGDSALKYPDTSKMSPEQIEKYPWKRQHWRQKAKKEGLPDPFDYGESNQEMKGFSQWLEQRSKKDS